MKIHVFISAIVACAALAACASNASHSSGTSSTSAAPATTQSPQQMMVANGRSIFVTGRDLSGVQIHAQPAALRPDCAACHRPNGAGGMHFPGGVVSADLRHPALVTNQHPPYTIALLERAISTGIDNTGQPLNRVMPRWKMSQRDLHDVASYVFTQLKK
jgi:mono/diheme cytochrome c family protein